MARFGRSWLSSGEAATIFDNRADKYSNTHTRTHNSKIKNFICLTKPDTLPEWLGLPHYYGAYGFSFPSHSHQSLYSESILFRCFVFYRDNREISSECNEVATHTTKNRPFQWQGKLAYSQRYAVTWWMVVAFSLHAKVGPG